MDNNSNLCTISLQEAGRKRNSKDATSFDAHSNPITIGDVVQVIDGEYKVNLKFNLFLFFFHFFLKKRENKELLNIFLNISHFYNPNKFLKMEEFLLLELEIVLF